jgi:hypothetical protein
VRQKCYCEFAETVFGYAINPHLSMAAMRSITYVSSAKKLFTDDDLVRLLHLSRDANAKHGITGLLLYKSGNFMQTIEGPDAAVDQLYINICNDTSHMNVTTIVDEKITARAFPEWHMGFTSLNDINMTMLPGFSNFLRNSLAFKDFKTDPSHAKRLLFCFRQGIR